MRQWGSPLLEDIPLAGPAARPDLRLGHEENDEGDADERPDCAYEIWKEVGIPARRDGISEGLFLREGRERKPGVGSACARRWFLAQPAELGQRANPTLDGNQSIISLLISSGGHLDDICGTNSRASSRHQRRVSMPTGVETGVQGLRDARGSPFEELDRA